MNNIGLLFEEEIREKWDNKRFLRKKLDKKISECLDYSICREKHCSGYGKINCRYYFKRRVNNKEIPCMSYREY